MAERRGFSDRARQAGVRDLRVLQAADTVDRTLFVPPDAVADAGRDGPLPLPFGQTTSQPSLVALMVEALAPSPADRVLDLGTGYGYQAALLGLLVSEVWSVERVPELADAARRNLVRAGATNVHVVVGDGAEGLAEHAPFDGVVCGARCDQVPPAWIAQVRPGGRLVLPLGPTGREQGVVLTVDADGAVSTIGTLGAVRFVPLVTGPPSAERPDDARP